MSCSLQKYPIPGTRLALIKLQIKWIQFNETIQFESSFFPSHKDQKEVILVFLRHLLENSTENTATTCQWSLKGKQLSNIKNKPTLFYNSLFKNLIVNILEINSYCTTFVGSITV